MTKFFQNYWRGKVHQRQGGPGLYGQKAQVDTQAESGDQEHSFTPKEEVVALADRINDDIVLTTPKGKSITVGEIRNSNRISKSSTPKHDLSWYIKWTASAFILASMTMRGKEALVDYDITLSLIGVCGWFIVGFLWNDRALILLNGAGILFFVSTILTKIVG
jgi:hypothetical protein